MFILSCRRMSSLVRIYSYLPKVRSWKSVFLYVANSLCRRTHDNLCVCLAWSFVFSHSKSLCTVFRYVFAEAPKSTLRTDFKQIVALRVGTSGEKTRLHLLPCSDTPRSFHPISVLFIVSLVTTHEFDVLQHNGQDARFKLAGLHEGTYSCLHRTLAPITLYANIAHSWTTISHQSHSISANTFAKATANTADPPCTGRIAVIAADVALGLIAPVPVTANCPI